MSKVEIIPAISGENFEDVREKIEKVKSFVNWVQIDVNDGVFAEPESWGHKIGHNLHLWETIDPPGIEMHLMIKNPGKVIGDWISASVDRILIHYESEGDKVKIIEKIKDAGVQVGLVLKMDTEVNVVEPLLKKIDVAQLMSIKEIGNYGADFDSGVLNKIKSLRALDENVKIQVDGGINKENADGLIEAGANTLVVGSAIFKSANISDTINKLREV